MIKLGVLGAMEQEVETLLSVMEDRESTTRGGCVFHAGKLEGLDAVVVQCGIGKVNAALSVQILCDCYGVTHLVNTGIAGSLDATLDIGDLVVSEEAQYHDFDCCAFGYPMGQVPGSPVSYPADPDLQRLAFAAAQAVHPGHCRLGKIASGDQFVADRGTKQRIIQVTGAVCTEMEGAAIAHAAYKNGLPFAILRAISDKADDSADMDYPTFERQAAHRCAEVTRHLARMLKE